MSPDTSRTDVATLQRVHLQATSLLVTSLQVTKSLRMGYGPNCGEDADL